MRDLLEQMRQNPKGDWHVDDVNRVCEQNEIICRAPTGGGSHYKIFFATMPEILTIPSKRPIKPIYIRKLVAFIDAARLSK